MRQTLQTPGRIYDVAARISALHDVALLRRMGLAQSLYITTSEDKARREAELAKAKAELHQPATVVVKREDGAAAAPPCKATSSATVKPDPDNAEAGDIAPSNAKREAGLQGASPAMWPPVKAEPGTGADAPLGSTCEDAKPGMGGFGSPFMGADALDFGADDDGGFDDGDGSNDTPGANSVHAMHASMSRWRDAADFVLLRQLVGHHECATFRGIS